MSENKKFDTYIKGLFKKDPKVPAELSWDAMDFDLPNTNKEVKKSNRKYFLLLLLLLCASSILYFGLNRSIDSKISTTELSNESSSNILIKSESIVHTTKSETKEEVKSKSTITNSSTSNLKQEESSKTTIATKAIPSEALKSQNESQSNTSNKNQSPKVNHLNNTSKQIETKNNETDNEYIKTKLTLPKSTISNQRTDLQYIKPIPGIPLINLSLSSSIDIPNNFSPSNTKKIKGDKKSNIKEILLGYGLNNFDLSIDQSNILNTKINKALGNSISAGIRLKINTKWKANLLVNYNRYHSTFEHTQELSPIIDSQNLRRINRKEITFHNNFTNTIDLQIGLERRLQLFNRVQLFTGFALTPTYTLSSTGKTTDGDTVTILTFDNQINKLSMAGSLNTGLIIPINKSINLNVTYQFNQFLLNEIFINNGINTKQQSSLSMILSYRF